VSAEGAFGQSCVWEKAEGIRLQKQLANQSHANKMRPSNQPESFTRAIC
jgi:hypothetical protein